MTKDLKSVRHLLNNKHKGFWTVHPDAMVSDALELMVANDVGAVAVIDQGALVGIITERDCTRKVLLQEKSAKATRIRDVMTHPVISVQLDQTVTDCLTMMTEMHIRHLPVLENDRMIGIISIRDAVRYTIEEQAFLIEQLEQYMAGAYPGMSR